MPEHLKALVVVLILSTVVFVFAKAPACAMASTTGNFDRRRNLWIGITLSLFLAHNFWIYICFAGALLLVAQAREPNKLAMYFFVLLAAPAIPGQVTGLGVVNFLFDVHYIRLLSLAVLFPAFLYLRKQPGVEPFGRLFPDKLVAGYLILLPLLMMAHAPFTVTLRQAVFYPFIDIFLVYYVASRGLKSVGDFRDALMAFLVAALVLSLTLVFESARRWLMYHAVEQALDSHWGFGQYLYRGANLRASGTTGHGLAAGYVVAVSMGLFLYLRTLVSSPTTRSLAWLLLAAGILVPISRSAWVGATIMLLVFIATGPTPVRGYAKLAMIGIVVVPLILVSPMGTTIIDHLPWIGTVENANVVARGLLAEVSTQVILENPVFGRFDYIDNPLIQALRGSDGIIDLVNCYVIVGLSSGLVGLSFYAGSFLAAGFGIYKGMRSLADKNDERHVLGQALLAALLGIMFIIGTVAPMEVIQAVYWSVTGVGVAYARMLVRGKASDLAESASARLTSARAAT